MNSPLSASLLARAVLVSVLIVGLASSVQADSPPAPRLLRTGSMAQILASHRGQPLVVHTWGVTCAPCLVELPRWASLLRTGVKARVVFIEAESAPIARTTRLLARHGLSDAEHWIVAEDESLEQLRDEIDPRWQGELPHTLLIDAEGQIRQRTAEMNPTALRAWLAGRPAAARDLPPSTRHEHRH